MASLPVGALAASRAPAPVGREPSTGRSPRPHFLAILSPRIAASAAGDAAYAVRIARCLAERSGLRSAAGGRRPGALRGPLGGQRRARPRRSGRGRTRRAGLRFLILAVARAGIGADAEPDGRPCARRTLFGLLGRAGAGIAAEAK